MVLKTFVTDDKGRVKDTFVTDGKGRVNAQDFHTKIFVHNETLDSNHVSSAQQIYGANMSCDIYTGSEVNLVGLEHLKKFKRSSKPYRIKDAKISLKKRTDLGSTLTTAKKIVTLYALHLTTTKGLFEFHKIELYLYERADERILGLSFTEVFGFDIIIS